VCLHGRVDVHVDDGRNEIFHVLASSDTGLYIPPGLWNRLEFAGPDTVILVFCDQPYDPMDYIRDRYEYLRLKGMVDA